MDKNNDGLISFEEFYNFHLNLIEKIEEEEKEVTGINQF